MIYHSTRNKALTVSSAEAIAQGIAADGGLFHLQHTLSLAPRFTAPSPVP